MQKENINKYINFLLVGYAFSFPISKALVSLLEIVIVLLWIYQGEWQRKYELLKSNRLILLMGSFVIFSFISIPWAKDTGYALDYIFKYYHFFMIIVLYTSLEKKYIVRIFTAFLISIFISELMSYGIFFELFEYKNATPQLPTPFMHHITYSAVLVFASTILLTNSFSSTELKSRIFNLLFFMTIVINLFINGGRTGQVIFVILILALFFMFIRNKLKAFIISLAIVVFTLFMAYNFSSNFNLRVHQLSNGFEKALYQKDYTDQGGMRIGMILIGTEIFLDNFFTGTGIGNEMKDANFYSDKNNYNTKDMNLFADYHNVFVNISVQLGIIGLIIVLLVFYSLFTLKIHTREYYILNRMFLVTFVLYSCTHNTFHVMNGMVFFALFAGLFNAISRIEMKGNVV